MSATEKNPSSQQSKPKGPIGNFLSLVGKVVSILFLSLIFSITIEWVGMSFWWEDQGHTHSRDLLKNEIGYLNRDFKESVVTSSPVEFVNKTAGRAGSFLFDESGFMSALESLRQNRNAGGIRGTLSYYYIEVEKYVLSAINIIQLFLVRFSIMVLSLPLFILFAVVGCAEGLMQRDLRRWGGGRESGFIYHHAKRLTVPVFLLAWLVYLSLPISLHPNFVLLPFASALAGVIYVSVSMFKKYL